MNGGCKETAWRKTEDSRDGILRLFMGYFRVADNFWIENGYNNHNPTDFFVFGSTPTIDIELIIELTFLTIYRVRICVLWWTWGDSFAFLQCKNYGFARSSPREQQSTGLLRLNSSNLCASKRKQEIPFGISCFLVTRWRFELQTHCLKGNCSANWASESYGWDGRIWTYECQSQSLVPYRLATSQWNAARNRTHAVL